MTNRSVRLVQFTDTHLLADPAGKLRGALTLPRLRSCLSHAQRHFFPADAIAVTGDIVQEAALHALRRLDTFEPRHVGAMQAYLRQSVINRIRDEVRRIDRQPPPVELPDDHPGDRTSPLELAIEAEPEAFKPASGAWGRGGSTLVVLERVSDEWLERTLRWAWDKRAAAKLR